jgi:hypothetical protein
MSRNPATGNTSGAERAAELERFKLKADNAGCPWCGVAGRWTRRVKQVGSPRDIECLKCGGFYTSSGTFSYVGITRAARRAFNRRALVWPFLPSSYDGHWVAVVMTRPLVAHKNLIVEFACDVHSERAIFGSSILDAAPTCVGCLMVYDRVNDQFKERAKSLKSNWGVPGWSLAVASENISTKFGYY